MFAGLYILVKKYNNELCVDNIDKKKLLRIFALRILFRLILFIFSVPYIIYKIIFIYTKSIFQYKTNPFIHYKMLLSDEISNKLTTRDNTIFITNNNMLYTNGIVRFWNFFKLDLQVEQGVLKNRNAAGREFSHKYINSNGINISLTTKQSSFNNNHNIDTGLISRHLKYKNCKVFMTLFFGNYSKLSEKNHVSDKVLCLYLYFILLDYRNNKKLPIIKYDSNKKVVSSGYAEESNLREFGIYHTLENLSGQI